jgi:molybdenum cofactor cytidylyltransferase
MLQSLKTAVLILAAGASKRLGKPKQQLLFHNHTLLNRIITTANNLKAGPVLVVVNEEGDLKESTDIVTVTNHHWQDGMATSIHAGIERLQIEFPWVERVIITVCDQPYISVDLFKEMIDVYQKTNQPIIACTYADTIGTPVLFHRSLFPELMELSGDKGARHLLNKDPHRVGLVNFPLGDIDIDTEEDYERLIKN